MLPTSKSYSFPETNWGYLQHLRAQEGADTQPVVELVATKYWSPIFCYLTSRGYSDEDAQDMVQDFFVFALQKHLFAKADPGRGRFRTFLLTSLQNFAANQHRNASAKKRQPAQGVGSLDQLREDAYFQPPALVEAHTPEMLFHRAWLQQLVRHTLKEFERECRESGKLTHFTLFESRVVQRELDGEEPPPLGEQAKALSLDYKEAANQLTTAKRAFLRLLEQEIRGYVGSADEQVCEQAEVLSLLHWE